MKNVIKGANWCSHLSLLKYCIGQTTHPVLEIGCGFGSTPFLHAWCEDRPVVSVDTNLSWVSKEFMEMATEKHRILSIGSYDNLDVNMFPLWGVVLIDHAPALRRNVEIMRVKDIAKYIVIHDTECGAYCYINTIPTFKYKLADARFGSPTTTVVSNLIPLPNDISLVPRITTLEEALV